MVFQRRTRRPITQIVREFFYPKGGWRRAATYVWHRLRRLPDEPHRIARGVFAGVFVSFTPLFGLHFLSAAGLAWILRGNILASLLATFVGNPLTTPLIAILSIETGHWILGSSESIPISQVLAAFSQAGGEISRNFLAVFTDEPAHWNQLANFFHAVFLPYLVGGIIPGVVISMGFYYLSIPLVRAYQKLRTSRLAERIEKRRKAKAAKSAASTQHE